MRKLILLFAFLISGVCLAANAHAARNISLPYSTDFTTNDISDLIWTSCAGASVTYSTNGYSGGAVKIVPPTDACASGNGGMSSIGYFQGFSTNRINIRFLMKIGPTYVSSWRGMDQNKFLDVQGTGGSSHRKGIFTLQGGSSGLAPGNYPRTSNWVVYRSPGTSDADHNWQNSPFKIYDGGAYSNNWICYEYEIVIGANTARVIITQQNGAVIEITTPSDPGGLITSFVLGGYHNNYSVADAGNWLLIDNLAVSGTGYIGPPSGFVGGGGTDIATPSRLRVLGQ